MSTARTLLPTSLLLFTLGQPALAQTGEAAGALPGVSRVGHAGPLEPGSAFVLSAGYGYTEAVLGTGDVHHRVAGAVAGSFRPVPWLGVGLALDGRYDKHSGGGMTDSGWVGDPRLLVRLGRGAGPLKLGAQATLWLPGGNAPSVKVDAASVDARVLGSWVPPSGKLVASANAGFRLDRSAASVDDPDLLSREDRLALGVSDSNAVLLGVGASYRASPRVEILGEWTWDLLVGGDAPAASESPMRVGAGARIFAGKAWQLAVLVEASPSSRPVVDRGAALVPVEPRFAATVGLSFGAPFAKAGRTVIGDAEGGGHHPPPPPPKPQIGNLRGKVLSPDGTAVVGARVRVRAGAAPEQELVTGEDGAFEAKDLPAGAASVTVTADGFVDATQPATVAAEAGGDVEVKLERALPPGELRGIVRSLGGQGIKAKVRVEPLGLETETAADGSFTLVVPPGDYEVVVSAPGYKQQRRKGKVEERGVLVLDLDLHKER